MAAILAAALAAVAAIQPHKSGDAPVVLELFTSQGCSSCPPADAYLRSLARDAALRGRVIPLAFHVDYWNSLGWRDPFSAREWSQRQGDYVRAMKLESAYTPQLVVNGTRQLVGSNSFGIRKAIDEESHRTIEGRVSLTPEPAGLRLRAESPRRNVEVVLAVIENDLTTNVGRGENGGKTFTEDAVVRKLTHIATLDGKHALDTHVALTLAAHQQAVVFLQDQQTRRIDAAAITQ